MPGKRLTSLVARSMDSLKLPVVRMIGRVESPFEMVRWRVTLRDAVVLVRSFTVQPMVPFIFVVIGQVSIIELQTAIIGQTKELLGDGTQLWRKETVADRL